MNSGRVDIIRAKHNTCLNNTNLGSVTAVNGKILPPHRIWIPDNFCYYAPPPTESIRAKLGLPPPEMDVGPYAYGQYSIGVNMSEQKSGTERTKKRELELFTPPGGASGPVVHRLETLNGFCTSYDNTGYRHSGPYAARTKSQPQNTHFIILQNELPSTGRWLLSST